MQNHEKTALHSGEARRSFLDFSGAIIASAIIITLHLNKRNSLFLQ